MQNLRFWLWLVLSGRCATERNVKILNHFGTPEAAFTAKRKDYEKIEGIRQPDIDLFCNKSLDMADRVLETCNKKEIRIVTINDVEYPFRLKHISPVPLLFYVKGEIPKEVNDLSISIVGTREPTAYGEAAAEKISYDLASMGVAVISGMARGVDTAAHKAALRAGGKTVAVLGSGVDYIYPYENKMLYEEITHSGAVISEFPPMTKPERENFPIRNRIISGISKGTVVVESNEKGGSMITARLALEQGRDVFAVPGAINSSQSLGTNELIKQGAKLVTSAVDVIEEYIDSYQIIKMDEYRSGKENIPLKVASSTPNYGTKAQLPEGDSKKVFSLLSNEPMHISDIAAKASLSAKDTATVLLMLEMDGYAISLTGGFYKIKN